MLPVLDRVLIKSRLDWFSWLTVRYVLNVALTIVVFGISLAIHRHADPVQRVFRLDNPDIAYPRSASQVSTVALGAMSICIPIGVFFLMNLIWYHSLADFMVASLGSLQALAITKICTDFLKVVTGRMRPYFLTVCDPDPSTPTDQYGLWTCRGDPSDVREARLSFLSGHTSYMFAAMVFTTLYIAGKWGSEEFASVVAGTFFMFLALWTGITRYADYKHHWSDILSGAILGLLVGIVLYHTHYPNVFCHKASYRRAPKLHSRHVEARQKREADHDGEPHGAQHGHDEKGKEEVPHFGNGHAHAVGIAAENAV